MTALVKYAPYWWCEECAEGSNVDRRYSPKSVSNDADRHNVRNHQSEDPAILNAKNVRKIELTSHDSGSNS